MGIILSRFRKKKTTIEILEDLDVKIKEIERYGYSTEQKHKKIVGTLILYSVILYIVTAFIFYFYFFPASLYDQIFYIIPLLIFPILILLTKKMVTWYYKRKISENQEKLITMRTEKEKILEEVTETETYKKAKEILLKFAPDQLRMTPLSPQSIVKASSSSISAGSFNKPMSPVTPSGDLRRRIVPRPPINIQGVTPINPNTPIMSMQNPSNTPMQNLLNTSMQNPLNTSIQSGSRPFISPIMAGRTTLPRPLLSRDRTLLDRVIDSIVGDGPSNRYALICRHCDSHNGMALKEEFEYFAFRCCYCNFWNPARKQKPFTPKIEPFRNPQSLNVSDPELAPVSTEHLEDAKVEPSTPTDSDSDIEVVDRPTEASEETEDIEPVKETCDEPHAKESESEKEHNCEESVEKMDIDESSS